MSRWPARAAVVAGTGVVLRRRYLQRRATGEEVRTAAPGNRLVADSGPAPLAASVDLYWLPLGAGGRFVRLNGRAFETIDALVHRRRRCDLYHSALEVRLGDDRFVIEQGPVWNNKVAERGVVCEGAVGSVWLGRSRLFRYEVRCWNDGVIPDVAEAFASPVRVSCDPDDARRILDLVHEVPRATWGRDELQTGEMWNSNSLISWLLARNGHDIQAITPPPQGRAPGWSAGLIIAERQLRTLPHERTVHHAPRPGT
ncbi:MAG: hypothetical protein ABI137_08575 [Antricoccus sp.]